MWKCENVHFFLRGYPMIFVKNWTFLLSLISFEKDLDVMFNYVRNEKKGCVDYKNVILRYCENGFFLRGEPRIFVKQMKVLLSPIFLEKYLDMMFNNVLNGKKDFLGFKNVILTDWAISIFAKGLTQDFPQNFERSFKSHFLWKRSRHYVE